MKFDDIHQHSIENLQQIEEMARAPGMSLRQALFVAEELVAHGHPAAAKPIALLQEMSRHRDVIAHAKILQKTYAEIRGNFHFEKLSQEVIEFFYRKNGLIHLKSKNENDGLLVIFTTMFNNMYLSNASLLSLFSKLPCDILLLKDTTMLNYHHGVDGFADGLPGLAKSIQHFARQHGKDHIYFTGYSSGGYAALLTSLLMPCHGYLGFSHQTDLSENSLLPPPKRFGPEIRKQVDPAWLLDCRTLLEKADPAVPRSLVYGQRSDRDVVHAQHLQGLETIRLICLPGATHNTIKPLLAAGEFMPMFRRLVAGE